MLVTLVSIVGIGPFFRSTPKAALAAIIVANLAGMLMQVKHLPFLWRTNKFDFSIWVVTFAAVVAIKVDFGLLIGLAFSLATIIYRTQAPAAYVLGRVPGTDIYRNVAVNKLAQEVPGVKIVKYDGNVYFGSAENFRRSLFRKTKLNPRKLREQRRKLRHKAPDHEALFSVLSEIRQDQEAIEMENQADEFTLPSAWEMQERRGSMAAEDAAHDKEEKEEAEAEEEEEEEEQANPIKVVILDMSACAFIDSVGVRVLSLIIEDYRSINVTVYMANVVVSVRKMLLRAGFYKKEDQDLIFVTVHDAVLTALMDIVTERQEDIPETVAEEGEEEEEEQKRRESTLTSAEVQQMKETIAQLQQSNKLLRKLVDFSEMAGPTSELPALPAPEAAMRRRGTVAVPFGAPYAVPRRLSIVSAAQRGSARALAARRSSAQLQAPPGRARSETRVPKAIDEQA